MQIFSKHQIALAAVSFLSAASAVAPSASVAATALPAGQYVAGDFHNHTTCSDGAISMQKLVNKSTGKTSGTWGLDWFVQAGHGGNGNRNCTLVEDSSLSTPAYPYVAGKSPTTTWASSIGAANVKGMVGYSATASGTTTNTTLLSTQSNPSMWRWQSIQEFQYPLMEYLDALNGVPLFMGLESVVAGHEHASMSIIDGQMPSSLDTATLPTTPGYTAQGNASALAQWSYCFDRGDTDVSHGAGNNWSCDVTGSANSSGANWNSTGGKIVQPFSAVGAGSGTIGHNKTLEALKWMAQNHGTGSYYVPAHLERAGPFNPDDNNGFNVEHLRDFNNTAPDVAFGFESQPGHGASANRGEYQVLRNSFLGSSTKVDSVGGTTYGGTGVYASLVGGVWDALLGEGRNFWFFASSDWHNRGTFGPDDRRSMQDFQPGEYQRNYTMVRNGSDKIRPACARATTGLLRGKSLTASPLWLARLTLAPAVRVPAPLWKLWLSTLQPPIPTSVPWA
jgi:hypothetical protein